MSDEKAIKKADVHEFEVVKDTEPIKPSRLKRTRHHERAHSYLPLVLAGVVLLVLGFYGGMSYQKAHSRRMVTNPQGIPGFGGQRFNGGFPGQGRGRGGVRSSSQVTAISDSSISVKDASGTVSTYTITTDTNIIDGNQSAAASDIQVGDDVLVRPFNDDSKTAGQIILNPGQNSPTDSGGNTPSAEQS